LNHRRSIRLKGYDYSQPGGYFVTLCIKERKRLLGDIRNGKIFLNDTGKIVKFTWLDLPQHNPNIELDEFIIMPNHMHGIFHIVGAGSEPAPTKTHGLPEIIRQFKTFSAKRINTLNKHSGMPFWQRNYYERIIRNDHDLNRIREYITYNPFQWDSDPENPDFNVRADFNVRPGSKPALIRFV
jgi:putative transposase